MLHIGDHEQLLAGPKLHADFDREVGVAVVELALLHTRRLTSDGARRRGESINPKIYAHLFHAAAHEEKVSAALEAAAMGGKPAENGGGERRRTDSTADAPEVAIHPATAVAGD